MKHMIYERRDELEIPLEAMAVKWVWTIPTSDGGITHAVSFSKENIEEIMGGAIDAFGEGDGWVMDQYPADWLCTNDDECPFLHKRVLN